MINNIKKQPYIIFLSFFLILFLITNCAYYLHSVEIKDKTKIQIKYNKKTICKSNDLKNKNDFILLGDNDYLKYFSNIIKRPKFSNLSFIQKTILLALLRISRRPNIASPTARATFLIHYNNKDYYFDFKESSNHENIKNNNYKVYPYIFGLKYILTTFNYKDSLNELAKLLNSNQKRTIIDKTLSSFIKNNHSNLFSDRYFKKIYFKAKQPLKKNETLPPLNYKKIVQLNSKKEDISIITNLSSHIKNKDLTVHCNWEMGQIFDNSKKDRVKLSEAIGIMDGRGNYAFISSNQSSLFKNIAKTYLIQGNSNVPTIDLCTINNLQINSNFSLISFKNIVPYQKLEYLIDKKIYSSNSINHLQAFINAPRFIKLKHSPRIIYESNRGGASEMKRLQEMNLPIYHYRKLGLIWSYANIGGDKGFILDNRGIKFECL